MTNDAAETGLGPRQELAREVVRCALEKGNAVPLATLLSGLGSGLSDQEKLILLDGMAAEGELVYVNPTAPGKLSLQVRKPDAAAKDNP